MTRKKKNLRKTGKTIKKLSSCFGCRKGGVNKTPKFYRI